MGVLPLLAYLFAAVLLVTGVALIISDAKRWRRRSLAHRLMPYAPTPLADEVEEWLGRREPG